MPKATALDRQKPRCLVRNAAMSHRGDFRWRDPTRAGANQTTTSAPKNAVLPNIFMRLGSHPGAPTGSPVCTRKSLKNLAIYLRIACLHLRRRVTRNAPREIEEIHTSRTPLVIDL